MQSTETLTRAKQEADSIIDDAAREAAARREEAEAYFEKQRATAAAQAADFERTLGERREKSSAEFTAQMAKQDQALAAVQERADLLAREAEEERVARADEAASLLSAQRSFDSLFTMLGHVDAVHGLYYVLLHLWIGVAGTSPFAIRLPSAVATGLAAAAVAWMCGRLGSRRLALLAGIVAAVLPRLTFAGEEARSYATDAATSRLTFAGCRMASCRAAAAPIE